MKPSAEKKHVFRMFWIWRDEEEERWLSEMARRGWHLVAPRPVVCTFEKGAPAEVAYRLDYQSRTALDKAGQEDYFALFKDAGWERVGGCGPWIYFRKPAGEGPAPEIFTDPGSRIAMYRRVMGMIVVFLGILIVTAPGPVAGIHTDLLEWGPRAVDKVYTAAFWIKAGLLLLVLYAAARVARRIHALGKRAALKG